jgi:hypothetical protein
MTDDQIIDYIESYRRHNGWTDAVLSIYLDIDPELYKACRDLRTETGSPTDAAWQALRHEWVTEIKEAAQRNGVPGLFD